MFLAGLVLLLVSTKLLVDKSQQLAHTVHLSPLIIGITVVAIGTSLPELAVSTISSIKGDYGLSLGNIVGSNITNILLVLAVGILVGKIRIGTTKTPKTTFMLIGITVLYIVMHAFSLNHLVAGLLLIVIGILVTLIEYTWGVNGQKHEDFTLIYKFTKSRIKFTYFDMVFLIVSVLGITFGGILIVNSVENLSGILGYSTTVLGLCLTSVATSLPELLTTIFSQGNKDEKLTVGNILGSNIYNIAFIGGIAYLFSNGTNLSGFDWIWFVIASGVLLTIILVFKGKYLPKLLGLFLLIMYAVYLFTVTLK
jgi:cation:H+ antiporter